MILGRFRGRRVTMFLMRREEVWITRRLGLVLRKREGNDSVLLGQEMWRSTGGGRN